LSRMRTHVFVDLLVVQVAGSLEKACVVLSSARLPSDYMEVDCSLCHGVYGFTQMYKHVRENVYVCESPRCLYGNWHTIFDWKPYFLLDGNHHIKCIPTRLCPA
jgi:hypothetical protein